MTKTTIKSNPQPQPTSKPTTPIKKREVVREYGKGGKINESAGPSGSPKK